MIKAHGSYIHDYDCFDIVRKLGLKEAFDLLKKGGCASGSYPGDEEFQQRAGLINKCWSIVETDRSAGLIRAVYNHDGRYSLHQASIPAFLKRIQGSRLYSDSLGKLYDDLAQPNENA